jgi:hypothetical protein
MAVSSPFKDDLLAKDVLTDIRAANGPDGTAHYSEELEL